MKKFRERVDTLIISDIHIPALASRTLKAMEIIEQTMFNRLILLGDIFNHFRLKLITKKQLEFLLFIESLLKKRPNIEVVWVVGNHDKGILQYQNKLNIQVVEEYVWTYGGKKYLAIHGHQYNHFLTRHTFFYEIACAIHTLVGYFNKKQWLSRPLKRVYLKYFKPSYKIAFGIAPYWRGRGIDCGICGHTHQVMSININGVKCLNAGCFDDIPSTYITIGEKGNRVHEVY